MEIKTFGTQTTNRPVIDALRKVCQQHADMRYELFSNDWIIKITKGDQTKFIHGYYKSDLNNFAAAENATDKVATYCLLKAAGLPAVEHILISHTGQPHVDPDQLKDLFEVHSQLVIKPNKAGHGKGVALCKNVLDVFKHTESSDEASWCASPYEHIVKELRLVAYEDEVLLAYAKTQPTMVNGLAMFNLQLGAKPQALEVADLTHDLKNLAAKATRATGLNVGAVDIAILESGQPKILEINASFSLDHYASSSPERYKEVTNLYEILILEMFNSKSKQ